MKKIIAVILLLGLVMINPLKCNALSSEQVSETFRITDQTTLGDVMRYVDFENFSSYSTEEQNYFDSLNFKELENSTEGIFSASSSSARAWTPTFAAGLSTDQSSPSKGTLSYSGTLEATEACPSLYLSAIVYDSDGYVRSEMANTRYNKTKVSVANVANNLISKAKYHVVYYGIIKAPDGLTPTSGVVTSTKYVTVK